jgi:hypothetical protein
MEIADKRVMEIIKNKLERRSSLGKISPQHKTNSLDLGLHNSVGNNPFEQIYTEIKNFISRSFKQPSKNDQSSGKTKFTFDQQQGLLTNPLFSLPRMLKLSDEEDHIPSTNNQIIEFFDTQSRAYLLQLYQRHMIDYTLSPIQLKHVPFQFPPKLSSQLRDTEQGLKNLTGR